MLYLDTNILIYSIVDQSPKLKEESLTIIEMSIKNNELLLSPLVLSEFIFTANKLKLNKKLIESQFNLYKNFVSNNINLEIIEKAFVLANKMNYGKNINDVIHLTFAENFCKTLYTADKDFIKFKNYTNLKINII